MPKKRKLKRVSKRDRAKILAEMKARGLTAERVAKKYRVSKWTIYGWRKRKGKTSARGGQRTSTNTKEISVSALRAEIRSALPAILSEELARALRTVVAQVMVNRRRRARKK